MDSMKDLENLCETLTEQIGSVSRKAKNGMSSGDLDIIEKLTHSLASVKKIMRIMEEDSDDGYSGSYGMGRGASYARNRGVRRDSMGRYSGYSRNDFADKIREIAMDAPDDRTRQELHRMIEKMESA